MNLRLTAAVTSEGALYVAQCLEMDITSQGPSIESALAGLKEALELALNGEAHQRPGPTPIIAPVEVTVHT